MTNIEDQTTTPLPRHRRAIARVRRTGRAGDGAWALGEQVAGLVGVSVAALVLTRELGNVGYGAFAATYNLMAPFLAFIQSGVSLAVLDQIVRERRDPAEVAGSYLGYVWSVGTLIGIVLSVFAWRTINGIPGFAVTLFIMTEFSVMSGMWAITSVVQASRGFSAAARIRVSISALRTGIMLVLALLGHMELATFSIVLTCAFAVAATVVHLRQQRIIGVPLRPRRFGRSQVMSTTTYAIGLSAVGIQDSYDQVVLQNRFAGDAGRYAAGYRVVSLGLMPIAALANATHMDFLDTDRADRNQLHQSRKFALLSIAYSLVFCGAAIIAAPLVPKILGPSFEGTVTMIRLLVPLVPLRGIGMFPMNGLLGLGRNPLRTKILVTSAAFSLVLYFVLIPMYSWKGAIAATLISESVLFIASWTALFIAQRQFFAAKEAALRSEAV